MAGIEFFSGAMDVAKGVGTADPDQPKMSSGGPIEVASGIDDGRSTTVPSKFDNMVSQPGEGKGSPISGPMDV